MQAQLVSQDGIPDDEEDLVSPSPKFLSDGQLSGKVTQVTVQLPGEKDAARFINYCL